MNRVWTEEELEILRQDRAARIPIPVTAAKLGRPVPATYARARLIGTLVQTHQPWDEESVARLRALVSADPPLTDKTIAAELNRTVTQIRWKMQDLGLIGVRNLSKLARATAARTARAPRTERPVARSEKRIAAPHAPVAPSPIAAARTVPTHVSTDPAVAIRKAVAILEAVLAERLKHAEAASQAGMIEAAKAAILAKAGIDARLAAFARAEPQAVALAPASVAAPDVGASPKATPRRPSEAPAMPPKPSTPAPSPIQASKPAKTAAAPKKPTAARPAVLPSLPGAARPAAKAAPVAPAAPAAPKILVIEAPAAPRSAPSESETGAVSGRGGWKSVRRDPARIAAQAKAKAVNRADAVDLAQAAQAAIERFIAERGITRNEADGVQTIVSRLQARGYIVVRDGEGWVIDQRHRVANENELTAFAEARGITANAA